MANLNGRRRGTVVEPERAGIVLPQWKQDDGGGDHDEA